MFLSGNALTASFSGPGVPDDEPLSHGPDLVVCVPIMVVSEASTRWREATRL
jgi:hypothetical protein